MKIQKYLKYPSETDSDKYWDYCNRNMIPCIQIKKESSDMDYLDIDCLPVFNLSLPNTMDTEELADQFMKFSAIEKRIPSLGSALLPLYRLYFNLFNIPDSLFSFSGGGNNKGLKVLKDHSDMIAAYLHDYFIGIRDDFFKKEGFDLQKFIVPSEWNSEA